MIKSAELKNVLAGTELDGVLAKNYKKEDVASQKERYAALINKFEEYFGADREVGIYSAPGRTEVGGNHTDHNHGCVLAASVNLDAVAVVSKNTDNIVRVKSEGYKIDAVDLNDLGVMPAERGRSEALIRGVCASFKNRGYAIGGFDAATVSDVLSGSGLSSSAAFEVLIGTILNHLYNDGKISAVEIAQIAQFAENEYFGKPCGLMDQMACAVGGFVYIDFEDNANPVVESVDFSLSSAGYSLCIVNTGGSHAGLNEDYASVPGEMKAVAAYFGKPYLRGITEEDILKAAPYLRRRTGDRAILRAIHFVRENERVERAKDALKAKDLEAFYDTILESGRSSYQYLQNVYTTHNAMEQGISLALCIADGALKGKGGAIRVHGGGFAGTIQAFVKNEELDVFVHRMDEVFGDGSSAVLNIRPLGAVKLF